ncbi:metal-nicotianamine transporter YSL3-like protein [Tanacetum coccineum]
MVMEHGSREINNMDMPEDQYDHTEHTDPPACDNSVDGMKRQQPWRKDITVRGIVASLMIGIMYSVIVMKLNLTTGLVPNLNVSAALLAFVFIRTWTKLLHKAGFTTTPFTRQENTVIQTCAVACYTISFGVALLVFSRWIPLRKIMIIDYKLTYPSGTATAVLINGFHTPKGDKMASIKHIVVALVKQVVGFAKFFTGSIVTWALISFNGPTSVPGTCLIHLHPDIRSYIVLWSNVATNRTGQIGFHFDCAYIRDGLYNFLKITFFTARNIYTTSRRKPKLNPDDNNVPQDNLQRDEVFLRESIPFWVAATGYVMFSIVSIIIIPIMFPELKWYYVLVAYVIAPSLGFCNAYGAGLTDMNMAYNYGKVALFVIAAMSGNDNGVVAGLVGCGLLKSIVSISSDLMHDFKTAHLTMTSPRSMLVSQAIGTAIGCVVAPLIFFLFYKAFDVGNPVGEYKAPYALIYRNMAILGVEGFSALPRHCLQLCYGFFAFAMLANLVRDTSPTEIGQWVPLRIALSSILALAGIRPPNCISFSATKI